MQPPPNLLGTYNADLQKGSAPTDFLLTPFALTELFSYKGKHFCKKSHGVGEVLQGRNSEYALITSKRMLLSQGNRCLSRPFSTNSPKNERLGGRTWLLKAILSLKSTIQQKNTETQLSSVKTPCKKQICSFAKSYPSVVHSEYCILIPVFLFKTYLFQQVPFSSYGARLEHPTRNKLPF